MMRLIDADEFIKDECNSCDGWCDCVNCDCLNCKSEHRCDFIQHVHEHPTATLYGYPIDKLLMFAEICKRNGIQEADLKQAAWNLELTVRAVMNERQEIVKNMVDDMVTVRYIPDFEKAFAEMKGERDDRT